MLDKIWFTFNNFDSRHYPEMFVRSVGRRVKTEENITAQKIPFRSEEYHYVDGTRKPYTRNIDITMLTRDNADKIFSKLSGAGILRTSDDPGVFFICRISNIIPFTQVLAGNPAHDISIPLKIQPYAYHESGLDWQDITLTKAIDNPGDTIAAPIYRIYGKGDIVVNGRTVSYSQPVGGNDVPPPYVDIDTDKCVAYHADYPYGMFVSGDIEDLSLNPGLNTISTTAEKLEIMPRFREV